MTLDLGDIFKMEVIYHDMATPDTPHPKSPGAVRGPDGKLYVLNLIEPVKAPTEVHGDG